MVAVATNGKATVGLNKFLLGQNGPANTTSPAPLCVYAQSPGAVKVTVGGCKVTKDGVNTCGLYPAKGPYPGVGACDVAAIGC